MKKVFICILIALVLLASTDLFAQTTLKKLGRGCANILTCPFEVPYRMGKANEDSGPFAALTWGLFEGIIKTCVRGVVGVYEVVTSPVPLPADYRPILTDPEYFLQDGTY